MELCVGLLMSSKTQAFDRRQLQKKTLILVSFLAVLFLYGCMLKGYQVDLRVENADHALGPVKALLAKEGYALTESSPIQRTQERETLERYRKEFLGIEKPFFELNADYSVHVDVTYSARNVTDIEVHIYNVYRGNDPKVKPALLEAAGQIEKIVQEVVPGARIIRSEGLTGIPLI
jgi:hypothetical protein